MNNKIADRVRAAVTIVSGLIMLYALFVSADHEVHVAHLIGLRGYQASTLWVLIDLPAVVGKALRLKYFAASTRGTGLRLMITSGTLSLVCNVSSGWFGGGLGPAAYGAFVVGMFLVMENVVTKIRPAANTTKEPPAIPANAPVSPGMPPLIVDPPEAIAYRQAVAQLRRTSALAALNGTAAAAASN